MIIKNERFPRGSFPPFIFLGEAITLAEKLYALSSGKASFDLLSRVTGNSISSSSFTKKLSALKAYGLVSVDQAKMEVALTDIGVTIAAPMNQEASGLARKEAFLRIEVFNRIYEKHKGKLLPADEFLRNIIEIDCQMPRELSPQWLLAFKQSIRAAGLLYDRGDGKMQIMESPIASLEVSVAASLVPPAESQIPKETQQPSEQPSVTVPFSASGHNTKIALSSQRYALFSIPDSLTTRDAQKIKSAIAGLSAIIDSMVEEGK